MATNTEFRVYRREEYEISTSPLDGIVTVFLNRMQVGTFENEADAGFFIDCCIRARMGRNEYLD